MIYFATPSTPQIRACAQAGWVGLIDQPNTGHLPEIVRDAAWIADCGVYGADGASKFDEARWRKFLADHVGFADRCVFAVVPDVVGDHRATLDQWDRYSDEMDPYRRAFVAQDGCTPATIPEDADALFVGGSTRFKLSTEARACVTYAIAEGMWTHMGRVNSRHRLLLAAGWGCDSVDGTYAAFGPDRNFPRILSWVEESNRRISLPVT